MNNQIKTLRQLHKVGMAMRGVVESAQRQIPIKQSKLDNVLTSAQVMTLPLLFKQDESPAITQKRIYILYLLGDYDNISGGGHVIEPEEKEEEKKPSTSSGGVGGSAPPPPPVVPPVIPPVVPPTPVIPNEPPIPPENTVDDLTKRS